MAGELDVYQSCPCGSGKKLKFCCQAIITDMQRVADLQQHHQYEMALSVLDGLEKKNLKEASSRAWIRVTKAMIYSATDRNEEARKMARDVLEELPGHPLATVLNAMLTLAADGYPAAKRAIYEVLELDREHWPAFMVSHLLQTLAGLLAAQGHLLAAREHAALAVLVDPKNEEAVQDLLEFQGDHSIPYPFRSHYSLAPFAGDESQRGTYNDVMQIVAQGRFSDAAKAFGAIARQNPTAGWIWWNIALCHAWAAEDPLAVQALKAGANHQTDDEAAADALLLARLLTPPAPENRIERFVQEFKVSSVGKLLTVLDQQSDLARMRRHPEAEGEETNSGLAADYRILDRDKDATRPADLTLENIPKILGDIQIYDAAASEDNAPRAIVSCLGKENLDSLLNRFTTIAGAEVERVGEPIVHSHMRAETAPLLANWYFPEDGTPAQAAALQQARWQRAIDEIWPGVPQEALGGKTPHEAAGVPELKTALLASILALDVIVEQAGYTLDQDLIRSRMGLPAVKSLDTAPDDDPRRFSILDARRLPLDRLTDEQLSVVTNLVTRSGHSGLSFRMIEAVLARPNITEKIDSSRLYMTLANLCRKSYRIDQALDFISRGKQAAREKKQPLDAMLAWEFEELLMRTTKDQNDPMIAEIAGTLWNYYRPKLPNAANFIQMMLNQLPFAGPWNSEGPMVAGSESIPAAGSTTPGGIWTPEAPAAAAGGSKLWLPGQA